GRCYCRSRCCTSPCWPSRSGSCACKSGGPTDRAWRSCCSVSTSCCSCRSCGGSIAAGWCPAPCPWRCPDADRREGLETTDATDVVPAGHAQRHGADVQPSVAAQSHHAISRGKVIERLDVVLAL